MELLGLERRRSNTATIVEILIISSLKILYSSFKNFGPLEKY